MKRKWTFGSITQFGSNTRKHLVLIIINFSTDLHTAWLRPCLALCRHWFRWKLQLKIKNKFHLFHLPGKLVLWRFRLCSDSIVFFSSLMQDKTFTWENDSAFPDFDNANIILSEDRSSAKCSSPRVQPFRFQIQVEVLFNFFSAKTPLKGNDWGLDWTIPAFGFGWMFFRTSIGGMFNCWFRFITTVGIHCHSLNRLKDQCTQDSFWNASLRKKYLTTTLVQ